MTEHLSFWVLFKLLLISNSTSLLYSLSMLISLFLSHWPLYGNFFIYYDSFGQQLRSLTTQYACLVSCLHLHTFSFTVLTRRKLTPMSNIASTCSMLQKFTVRTPRFKISRIRKDLNLHVKSLLLRKIGEKLKNIGNFRFVFVNFLYILYLLLYIKWEEHF